MIQKNVGMDIIGHGSAIFGVRRNQCQNGRPASRILFLFLSLSLNLTFAPELNRNTIAMGPGILCADEDGRGSKRVATQSMHAPCPRENSRECLELPHLDDYHVCSKTCSVRASTDTLNMESAPEQIWVAQKHGSDCLRACMA